MKGLPQNVLLNFRLEFPKSDLTIYLPSGISDIFCQMVSTPDPTFFFRARISNVNVQCLPSRIKGERYWSTVAPENEEHLGPENRVHYAQELRFFFSQRTIIWRYKM